MCTFRASWRLARNDFASASKARADFRSRLARMCGPESDLSGAEIVFGELVTNALRYSGTGATAEVLCDGNRVILEIEDGGSGFDPEAVAARARRGDEAGGRGFEIARKLSRLLSVEVGADGCIVRADLPVNCRASGGD